MNSVAEDFKDRLVSQSVATFATDLFVGTMPDSPDLCLVIRDTAGFKPESRYEWKRPGAQIVVRGAEGGYRAAYTLIKAAYDALHAQNNLTINSTVYKLIEAAHEPIYLGEDDKERPMFSLNFEVQRAAS